MNYFDELLYHEIMCIFYANQFSSDVTEEFENIKMQIKELLSEQESVTTKKKANELMFRIKDILTSYGESLSSEINTTGFDIVSKESEWFSNLIKDKYNKNIDIPKNIESMILSMPYTVTDSSKSFVDKFIKSFNYSCRNVINASLFMNYPASHMLDIFDTSMNRLKNNIITESQTMTKSFVDNTQKQIKKSNPKIFTGHKWCSILDSRTCDECADLDGTIYSLISDAPFSPIHYKCRCSIISFVQEDTEPEWTTFEEWVSGIPEEKQKDILGKKRFDLWKSGDLKIKDFVNDGKKIKLKDLYKS